MNNIRKNFLRLIAAAVLLPGLVIPTFSEDNRELSEVHGVVRVMRSGGSEWIAAEEGIPVYPLDRVQTEFDSSCRVALRDGSQMMIDENSDVTFLSPAHWDMTAGKVLGFSSRAVRVEIATPRAVVEAVPGSGFVVEATPEVTRAGAFEGALNVTQPVEPGKQVGLHADQEVMVADWAVLPAPREVSMDMDLNRDDVMQLKEKVPNIPIVKVSQPVKQKKVRKKPARHQRRRGK